MNELTITDQEKDIIASVVLNGDISKLSPEDQVKYYDMFCRSLGLNPVTQPFDIIILNGKKRLYAKKDATEQLRKINGVSILDMQKQNINDLYVVTVKAQDKTGRTDISTGAVNIKGLSGDALANAIMKAETKAKRRATLSICGLGILDETELETIPEIKNVTLKSDNEKIFQDRWSDYEKIIEAIKDIMTDPEKESDQKIRSRKNTIQDINKAIEYYLKKYSIEIAKFNEGIQTPNITITEDLK